MDDDSLYVVLKVYGHLYRNERKHPEERFFGCFFVVCAQWRTFPMGESP